jgi:hypothetical protein
MLESNPTAVADHVRSLCIDAYVGTRDLAEILSWCGGTSTLAIFFTELVPELLVAVARMPLQRLCAMVQPMFGPAPIYFEHPVFWQLTHLHIHDYPAPAGVNWATWASLALMPCLTHLSFNDIYPQDILQGVLANCAILEVLTLIIPHIDVQDDMVPRLEILARDFRFVVMVVEDFLEDWEEGARGGDDYWVKAEKFIKQRRSGNVEGGFDDFRS